MTTISKTPTISTGPEFTRSFHRRNWLILVLALVGSALIGSQPIFTGVLAGGLIAIFSFCWLQRSLKNLLGSSSGSSKFWMQVLSLLKVVLIALILMLLIMNVAVDPIGLLIGLSIVIMNVFYVVIKSLFTGDIS